ncbi:hypothetical protein F2Q68_00036626 [Brassica cretica]|uniref:Uncharacterized protein n=1 Tax=Brassica cretica TaxID=69181 RepID=A0A8S9GXQ5_BRACR|nr:hypothetical protein F2Q68_00036626 [Brassica cretica]
MLCSRLLTPVVRVLLGGIIRLLIPVVSRSPWRNHPALVCSSPASIDLRMRSRYIRLKLYETQVSVRRY